MFENVDGWTDDGRQSHWYTNSSPRSLRLRWAKNEFWKDVLKALLKLQTVLEVDNGKGKADHIPIFYNKFLHIANDGFFYKSWFNNGVKYITDLMDSNGNFIK